MSRLFVALVFCLVLSTAMGQAGGPATTPAVDTNAVTDYRIVGLSDGETSGDTGGIGGLDAMCVPTFGASARACTTLELGNTPEPPFGPQPPEAVWIRPFHATQSVLVDPLDGSMTSRSIDGATGVVLVSITFGDHVSPGFAISQADATCTSWTSDASDRRGTVWRKSGSIIAIPCSNALKVLCCAPRDDDDYVMRGISSVQ